MKEPLKEPTIISVSPTAVATLFSSLWVVGGIVIFRILAPDPMLFRLLGALIGGFLVSVFTTIFFVEVGGRHRPMTPEERAEWEKKNARLAAAIQAARENREGHLRQIREGVGQLIIEMETDPIVGRILRDVRWHSPKEAGEQLLANADIALAGLGAWLTEQGIPNQLPGDLFAGAAKRKIEGHFSSLSPKERTTLQKYLSRVAQVLEEALEVMSPKEVVREILLPLFFGETTDQTQDE